MWGPYLTTEADPVNYRVVLPMFTWTGTVNWGQAVAVRKMKWRERLLPHIHILLAGPSQRPSVALLMLSGK